MVEPKTPFGVRSGLLLSGIGRTAAGGPPAAEAAADLPTYLSAHHAANVSRTLDATRLSAERSAGAIVRARLEQDWLTERMRMLGPQGSGSGAGAAAAAAAAAASSGGGGGGGGGAAGGEFAVIGMTCNVIPFPARLHHAMLFVNVRCHLFICCMHIRNSYINGPLTRPPCISYM